MNRIPRFSRLTTIIAVTFCALCITHRAEAVEALLVQDTYVDSSRATTNNGTSGNLVVSKSSTATTRAFLKFNIATLPAGTVQTDIKQARLRLWVNSSSTTVGAITLTPVTSAWNETTLTNSTSSSLTFGLQKHANLSVSFIGQFVSLDVTDWVQAWVAGTLVNEGFQIETGTNSTTLSLYFDSKESTTTSHEPQLEIVLNGPPGPQGSPGPQGPQGIQGLTGPGGPQGAQGIVGPAGSVGPQGSPGPAGSQGPQGTQGIAGLNGSKWYTGTGAPTSGTGVLNDYYLNTDTSDVWQKVSTSGVVAWAVQGNIRGASGAVGPSGTQGIAGPKGDTGAAGAIGPKGDAGSQGPQGATGAQGPAGPLGPTGPAGAQGTAGPQGLTGPPGTKGDNGSQGLPGTNGVAGPAGPQGPAGPAAVWPVRIQPLGDLAMGQFTNGPTP